MKYIRILLIAGLCATPALSLSDRAIETIFRGSTHAIVELGTAPWMEGRARVALHIHLATTLSVGFRLAEYGLNEVLSLTAATLWWFYGLTLYTYDLMQGMNNLNQIALRRHNR